MTPDLRARLEALSIVARLDPTRLERCLETAAADPQFTESPARVFARVVLARKLTDSLTFNGGR